MLPQSNARIQLPINKTLSNHISKKIGIKVRIIYLYLLSSTYLYCIAIFLLTSVGGILFVQSQRPLKFFLKLVVLRPGRKGLDLFSDQRPPSSRTQVPPAYWVFPGLPKLKDQVKISKLLVFYCTHQFKTSGQKSSLLFPR